MTKVVKLAVATGVTIGAWALACVPTRKKKSKAEKNANKVKRMSEETLEQAAKLYQEIKDMDKTIDETVTVAEETLDEAVKIQKIVNNKEEEK